MAMTATNGTQFDLTSHLTGQYRTVELTAAKNLKRGYSDKADKALLAQATGDDESVFGAIPRKLFPIDEAKEAFKPYDDAKTALKNHYQDHTIPFEQRGSRAGTRRLIHLDALMGGGASGFDAENRRLTQAAYDAAANLAADMPRLIQLVQASGKIKNFRPELYDGFTFDAIVASGTFTPVMDTMEALPSGIGVPASNAQLKEAQAQFEARLEGRYKFGMQRSVSELGDYLKNMAERVGALVEWENTPDHLRQDKLGRSKAPPLRESLFTNVASAARKLKEFAIPETEEGAALIQLVDDIDTYLAPAQTNADMVKGSMHRAERMVETASELAEALDAMDVFA